MKKSVAFSGRTSRSEFWWFASMIFAGLALATFADYLLIQSGNRFSSDFHPLIWLYLGFAFVPFTAGGARRLQDMGLKGWLVFIPFAILVGGIFGMVLNLGLPPYYDLGNLKWVMSTSLLFFTTLSALAICLLFPSDPNPNKFGPNPNEVPS